MKKIVFIFLALVPIFTYGQNEDTSTYTKFDVGFSLSPDYSYRFLKADASSQWLVDGYDSLEYSRVGYSLGLNGVFHYNSKLDFLLGAYFSDKGEKTKKENTPSLNNYTNHYYYLDIPIRANYYFLEKKLRCYASLGLSPSVFLNHTIISKVEGNTSDIRIVDNSMISSINLTALAGAGFDINLTNRWYFKFECLYKQSITSISNNTPVKKYFYGISPSLGFYVHL
jgi:hypothetical protein